METYEEKYKDLVKRLNKAREEKGVYTFNSVLDAVAPELKIDESEDERICGELIAFLKQCKAVYGDGFKQFGLDIDDALAWFEKQTEQKTTDKVEPKFKVGDTIKERGDKYGDSTVEIVSIDTENYYYFDREFPIRISEQNDWELVEQKPTEWSEEDIKTLERVVCILDGIRYYNTVDSKQEKPYQSEIDWLNSLKERVQPKQEWSEEDERNLQGIIDEIEVNRNHAPGYDIATYDKFLSWLKSLKDRFTWKPSEEQMEALKDIFARAGAFDDVLLSLINDLKKLKG